MRNLSVENTNFSPKEGISSSGKKRENGKDPEVKHKR